MKYPVNRADTKKIPVQQQADTGPGDNGNHQPRISQEILMNTRLLFCTSVLAAPFLLAASPADATAAPGGQSDCHAQLVPAVLPHTADAIEGWFRACYERQGGLQPTGESDCHRHLVPAVLPHTADAIEGWFRACYELEGGLEATGPADDSRGRDDGQARRRGVDTPSWMPRDPPPNWRRLMNEIEPDDGVDQMPAYWRRFIDEVDTSPRRSGFIQDEESSASMDDGSLEYAQIALGGLAGATIAAAAARTLVRRRRQPRLEAALASNDPDELPRAAGLLGDRFAQQDRASAAEHAYRAAIDVGDPYWSPIAQVALADLLSDRGELAEAQALLEAAIVSGHPRAVPAAQTSLVELRTGTGSQDDVGPMLSYETLGDAASARRELVVRRSPPIT